ncbi:hypothetical protein ACE0DR_12525 [Azotobacter sp. CWF10]
MVTGAMALPMITLMKGHGLQHLLAVLLPCGLLQIGAAYFKFGAMLAPTGWSARYSSARRASSSMPSTSRRR